MKGIIVPLEVSPTAAKGESVGVGPGKHGGRASLDEEAFSCIVWPWGRGLGGFALSKITITNSRAQALLVVTFPASGLVFGGVATTVPCNLGSLLRERSLDWEGVRCTQC